MDSSGSIDGNTVVEKEIFEEKGNGKCNISLHSGCKVPARKIYHRRCNCRGRNRHTALLQLKTSMPSQVVNVLGMKQLQVCMCGMSIYWTGRFLMGYWHRINMKCKCSGAVKKMCNYRHWRTKRPSYKPYKWYGPNWTSKPHNHQLAGIW